MRQDRFATLCKINETQQIDPISNMDATVDEVKIYDATPDDALASLVTHEGPVYIDLDETLYLRSSTEDYLDSAQPGVLAMALLQVLEFLRPWNWIGGPTSRDFWRVSLIRTCLPWVRLRWRGRRSVRSRQAGHSCCWRRPW